MPTFPQEPIPLGYIFRAPNGLSYEKTYGGWVVLRFGDITANEPGDVDVVQQGELDGAIEELLGNVPTSLNTLEKIAVSIGNKSDFIGFVNVLISQMVAEVHEHSGEDITSGTIAESRLPSYLAELTVASKAYVLAEIANLVDSSPGTLDTLNEIATALGNDPDFSTTILNQLALKSDIGHGHAIGDITNLQTTLDGKSATGHTHSFDSTDIGNSSSVTGATVTLALNALLSSITDRLAKASNLSDLTDAAAARSNLGLVIGTDVQGFSSVLSATTESFTTALLNKLNGVEANAKDDQTAAEILTLLKTVDGPGSGLNAELLAGYAYSVFLRYNVENQTVSGGASITEKNLGTKTSGTLTVDVGDRAGQYVINGGAFALDLTTVKGSCYLDITNNASAGAIDTSAFAIVTGDPLTTTDGHKFRCVLVNGQAGKSLNIMAMQ